VRRSALAVAGAAAAAIHVAPLVTTNRALRRRFLPGLAGIGGNGHVALTFDDGPDPASTPAFLATLDELGVKATFFMLGSMVRANPGLAAEVSAAGHEIAVHGDEHRSHLFRSPGDVRDDMTRATDTIVETTGQDPAWFRPPFGTLSNAGLRTARRLRLRPVLWSAWGRDWRADATTAGVTAEIERDLGPGATVLLHDSDRMSAPGSWRTALGSVPALVERCREQGLAVGPLAEHGLSSL
jgi:peptidoglycan-N-acetylglucosamine deacetylase